MIGPGWAGAYTDEMRKNQPGWRTARALSVAVLGLFAGHMLLYRLVAPGALQRAYLLASTGHAYLPPALSFGAGLAVVAVVATILAGARRAARGGHDRPDLLLAMVVPAVAQAAAFVVLEVAERALAGAPLTGLLGPLLPLGIVLQLVVGALGGLALFGLERVGEKAGTLLAAPARRRPQRARIVTLALPATPHAPRRTGAGAFGIRGPPQPA